ncbi:MAG: ACP S-malonyltransferase [Bacilli bacterium]
MKIGFLFAGQGQQFLDMGLDFYNEYPLFKKIVLESNQLSEYDYLSIIKDKELLNDTLYTQPAILTFSYGITKCLEHHKIKPAIVAGLSLGEYNALLAANIITFQEALPLVKKRALIMSNALEKQTTSMAALLKADLVKVNHILAQEPYVNQVCICNYNTFDQVVIGGKNALLDQVLVTLKEDACKRAIKLDVSTISHHPLLLNASLDLKEALNELTYHKPDCLFINNIEATFQEDSFIDSLSKQIAYPTLMANSIVLMLESGVDTFIEIGPGQANSGFVKALAKSLEKDVKIYSISSVIDFNKTIEMVGESNE